MNARPPLDLMATAQPAAIAQLIPVGVSTIGAATVRTTNARDLRAFLNVGKDFSTWVKAQITRARLIEGRDFVSSPSRGSSGQHTVEYHLTLEAGKHVAMLSETDKGFEVREYFIDCERRALAPAGPVELTRMDLIELAMSAERERLASEAKTERLEHQVAEQAPAVAGFDLIANADADGTMCIRDAAAALQMRQCDLTDYLIKKSWIYEREGAEGYKAYRTRLQSLDLKYNVFGYESKSTGERKARQQIRITHKGLTKLAANIASDAAEKALAADAGQCQKCLPLPEHGG